MAGKKIKFAKRKKKWQGKKETSRKMEEKKLLAKKKVGKNGRKAKEEKSRK